MRRRRRKSVRAGYHDDLVEAAKPGGFAPLVQLRLLGQFVDGARHQAFRIRLEPTKHGGHHRSQGMPPAGSVVVHEHDLASWPDCREQCADDRALLRVRNLVQQEEAAGAVIALLTGTDRVGNAHADVAATVQFPSAMRDLQRRHVDDVEKPFRSYPIGQATRQVAVHARGLQHPIASGKFAAGGSHEPPVVAPQNAIDDQMAIEQSQAAWPQIGPRIGIDEIIGQCDRGIDFVRRRIDQRGRGCGWQQFGPT